MTTAQVFTVIAGIVFFLMAVYMGSLFIEQRYWRGRAERYALVLGSIKHQLVINSVSSAGHPYVSPIIVSQLELTPLTELHQPVSLWLLDRLSQCTCAQDRKELGLPAHDPQPSGCSDPHCC